jgi:trimeric autotransporter adhesin
MKTITTLIYAAFGIVILAFWTLTANGAPGDLFASVNGGPGNGLGFIYKYAPNGVQSTFAPKLSRPRGLAFDSEGNLFVATNFASNGVYNATILKIAPDGAQNVFGTVPASFFAEGVAIDRLDNVFVMVILPPSFPAFGGVSLIYKFTPDGIRMPFGSLPHATEGFGLTFDSMGNLFAADFVAQTIYKFTPDGTRSIFVGPEAFRELGGPIGLAFEHFGNLFVSVSNGVDAGILKFTPSAVETKFATGIKGPSGLVFDSAGNLFATENPLFTTGDVLKFTPDGMRTVFASGIVGPEFLAMEP